MSLSETSVWEHAKQDFLLGGETLVGKFSSKMFVLLFTEML